LFQVHEFCFSDIPFFGPESSTSFTSYIVHIISIHLARVLQPLQFSLLPSVLILNIHLQTMVYAAVTRNDLGPALSHNESLKKKRSQYTENNHKYAALDLRGVGQATTDNYVGG
jgi:hypothetical protein